MTTIGQSLTRFSAKPLFNFIKARSGPYDGEVSLTRDRVYIVPTRMGLLFGALLLTLLVGSINYEKSLGFILTFLLAGLGNVALLMTWQNIAGLTLKSLPAAAVFAGERTRFSVQLVNPKQIDRFSLVLSKQGNDDDIIDCPAGASTSASFSIKAEQRGRINAGRFRLYTTYPTGLFIAWTWVDLSMQAIVYPQPDRLVSNELAGDQQDGDSDRHGNGQDNFSHLRKYHHGDKPNMISWKAAARTGELFTKSFTGANPKRYWIDWHQVAAEHTEQRLSIMTSMLIHAHAHQHLFGLKLPGQTIEPDTGNSHYHRCLTALALYQRD